MFNKPIGRIIVEGSDQQGKSTVVEMITDKVDIPSKHFTVTPEFNWWADYFTEIPSICDRSFISELVYSEIRGEESRVVDVEDMMTKMQEEGTIVLYMDRGSSFVFDDREEMFARSQIEEARDIYAKVMDYVALFLPVIKINLSNDSDLETIDQIADYLKGQHS